MPAALRGAGGPRHPSRHHVLRSPNWTGAASATSREGRLMPEDGLDQLLERDAILLGAVGDPRVPDHVSLWGLLIPIRRTFDQYVNLRPVRLFPGVAQPAARTRRALDIVIVRENVEGEYSEVGGRVYRGHAAGDGRPGVDVHAARRRAHRRVRVRAGASAAAAALTSADEVQRHRPHACRSGTRSSREVAARLPGRRDATRSTSTRSARRSCMQPGSFDVVVGSNLFGDILTDLAAGARGLDRHRAVGEPQPRARVPVDVRARPRLGARHRRQGHRQPDRRCLVGAMMLEHLGHGTRPPI